jgi:thiamine-monophosphate kinase
MEPMDEFDRLASLRQANLAHQSGTLLQRLSGVDARLTVGADRPDDCAVISLGAVDLVIGSDYVRGVKFSLFEWGYLDYYDLGYYLVAANLSDVAAMGAKPLSVLTVVRYPKSMPDQDFQAVMDGISDACRSSGTLNIGGDIGTAERLILSGTATGLVSPGRAILRSGGAAGDRLFISGPTGIAGAALAYFSAKRQGTLKRELPHELEMRLLTPWRHPTPRFDIAGILSAIDGVTTCQDTSDGLLATLQQIGAASAVGFSLDADAYPLDTGLTETSDATGIDVWELAFSASVDFQLAFTVRADAVERLHSACESAGVEVFPIGVATRDLEIDLRIADGDVRSAPGTPWRHQT